MTDDFLPDLKDMYTAEELDHIDALNPFAEGNPLAGYKGEPDPDFDTTRLGPRDVGAESMTVVEWEWHGDSFTAKFGPLPATTVALGCGFDDRGKPYIDVRHSDGTEQRLQPN